MRGKGMTVLTYGLIDLTGKTSENGQNSWKRTRPSATI